MRVLMENEFRLRFSLPCDNDSLRDMGVTKKKKQFETIYRTEVSCL